VIPIVGAILGGVFGLVAFFAFPTIQGSVCDRVSDREASQILFVPNVWVGIITGVASGLSATGANQIFKQLKKFNIEVKDGKDGE
jgi:hypothetical protein